MQNITQNILPGLAPAGTASNLVMLKGVAVGTLLPQESALYPTLFRTALGPKLSKTETTIPGTVAASFLKRSGLSKKQLHDIWELSDSENSGYLTVEGFFRACRLVAHGQSGQMLITADLLSVEPESLPHFEGLGDKDASFWKPSEEEIARYAELFEREGAGNMKMDGSDARSLLIRSGLSNSDLCDIWDLADADKDGKLTFGEFIVLMQIVSKVRDGSAFIPGEIPTGLIDYLKTPMRDAVQRLRYSVPVESVPTCHDTAKKFVSHEDSTMSPGKHDSVSFGNGGAGFDCSSSSHGLCQPNVKDNAPVVVSASVDQLAHQFDRQNAFKRQLADARARLESLRLEARSVEHALIAADHNVSLLQDQILGLRGYIGEATEEMEQFRREVACGVGELPSSLTQAVESVAHAIADDEREVMELRAQLERINREKIDLQAAMQVLGEKKRQADQDRNLMIIGLESDRAKLVTLRADRLKLWEQRSELTKELTTKTFDQLAGAGTIRSGVVLGGSLDSVSPSVKSLRDRKGIRADNTANSNMFASPQWDRFGAGGDPLAGAFENKDIPHFGSRS